MNEDQSLIVSDVQKLPLFSIGERALTLRNEALASAALIGSCKNADENNRAVNAQKQLKGIALDFEKCRKRLKEPLLDAGRKLDSMVARELQDVEKEIGRIQGLTSEFQR